MFKSLQIAQRRAEGNSSAARHPEMMWRRAKTVMAGVSAANDAGHEVSCDATTVSWANHVVSLSVICVCHLSGQRRDILRAAYHQSGRARSSTAETSVATVGTGRHDAQNCSLFQASSIETGRSQFAFEGAAEDGGEQHVEFGDGLGLQPLQRVHLFAKLIEPKLLRIGRDRSWDANERF